MDEDDSQDELINRSASHSKGKRTAVWVISDDSDSGESEEGESDSGEEEEGHLDGEEDDDDEEEDEEEEEEEEEEEDDGVEEGDAKAEDGAFGGIPIDLTEMSSDEDAEKCPICLNSFSSQPVATPESCEHYFCLDCILAWAKNANSCPVDRIAFNSIYLRKCYGGKVKKMITVQKPVKEGLEEIIDVDLEQTSCEVCRGSDREDRLLLCDGCDAGYHMECLTPPLDSVPVEEWFCPGCEASNRQSRASADDVSDVESLPSTARPATSRPQSAAAGPTRAIARTQQSERVRANVNRHRITQARSSQLAPTYLIESNWLDDTINAVVSGLNTAVYIRDLTPRVPSSSRRKTGKRRKVRRRKTSSATGKSGTGVRRRRRKVRRTKSRKNLMLKKAATPRGRIASNLRIVKDKKNSSLPTVYRPSEQTLSSMRADIGAASLSIYGDPFDLDPFLERIDLNSEGEGQQARVTTLLEAKRRGISRSALRSHQPVARPVTAGVSRRGMNVHHSGRDVEVAPVPDLLGSILSGQSVLLMDSSDVVINRDGTLKAIKPTMPSALNPSCSSPGVSPNQGDGSQSFSSNGDLAGSSHGSVNGPNPQSSSRLPPQMPSSASHIHTPSHLDFPPRGHPRPQPPRPSGPTHPPGHWRNIGGVEEPGPSSSIHPTLNSASKSKERASSQFQPKKAATKPTWVDVSVLPRIPKIKKERSGTTQGGSSQGGSNKSSSSSARGNGSNGFCVPETGMTSFAGDKARQQSVDQQKGRADGPTPRPDGAGSSSTFSNSFSSSSSPGGSSASQPRYSLPSSSSSAVSFRINSSGNSWQSRQLSGSSSSAAGGSAPTPRSTKEDEAKKRQMHRDKKMLLASRMLGSKEPDSKKIYDPFDPTLSDSSSSGDEAESTGLEVHARHGKPPSSGNKGVLVKSEQDLVSVKTERQEVDVSQEEPRRTGAQETTLQKARCSEENVKVEKECRLIDIKTEKQTSLLATSKVKTEPGLVDAGEDERFGCSGKRFKSEKADDITAAYPSLHPLKTERETLEEESSYSAPPDCESSSSASSSAPTSKKQKLETKSDSKPSPASKHSGHEKNTLTASKETHRDGRADRRASVQDGRPRGREKDRGRSSKVRTRRSTSTSESSQGNSPDTKRRRSRSRSKDRRRSRSGSSSSSKERSRKKKQKQKSKESSDGRERDGDRRRASTDKRRGRSRSRSRSKDKLNVPSCSESRSRSGERRDDHTQPQPSSLSSRDKVESQSKDKKGHGSRSISRDNNNNKEEESSKSKSFQKTSGSCVSSSKDTRLLQGKKKDKDISERSLKDDQAAAATKRKIATIEIGKKAQNSPTTTAETVKEIKMEKEIKEEKQQPSLDMFEDYFSPTQQIKKEEPDAHPSVAAGRVDKEEDPIKTEMFEIKTEAREVPLVKSEPSSPGLCHFTSFPALTPADAEATPPPGRQPDASRLALPLKREALRPSDEDEDLNVDAMLDSLDGVKCEEDTASVKHEREVEEKKEPAPAAAGAKAKVQVKRVTWNIQEPEGPQPQKSASKLSLYKLKLKQEGARRPSSAVQTSGQEIPGAVSRRSKATAAGPLNSSSTSEGEQGDAEEGDLPRNDQYLKKLHMQERAVEEVKLAIKPFYQRRDIDKDEYKEILRKAVQKVCHSKSGEINPVKVGNLVKAYVDKYKHARKRRKGEDSGQAQEDL
ncbi:PHD and RING finger domain-containing protein 1 [Pungitius pungitius]|uniref:PHD and RING finger domain-containing protein 1 n=1 Tax=Pungitius pungitius TaxID=134920 RepID=UPI002E14E875